jgi:tRNA-Thr(GGU) m(6)t(6)A37 methyltransferase TsaA
VFEPDYAIPEALRGIEGYSHLWLIWGANLTPTLSTREGDKLDWSPTVRPPRLGGNKRMGVFATRSPFRPNPIGLSSVKLIRVENGELIVSGADVLDGTPIYDIKPYLSFSDSHPDAKNGFAEETKDRELEVDWSLIEGIDSDVVGFSSYEPRGNNALITRLSRGNHALLDAKKTEIEYILCQDPRPGYQDNPERVYKMDYAGIRVSFKVKDSKVVVLTYEYF